MENTMTESDSQTEIASERLGIFGAVRFATSLLPSRDRVKFRLVIGIHMCLAVLDLAGVLLLGAVGFLAALSIQSASPPASVLEVQRVLNLEGWTLVNFTGLVAAIAACFLVTKSLLSLTLTRRTYKFLGRQQARVSIRLTTSLMNSQLAWIESRSSQETAYALTRAVSITIVSLLGSYSIALSETALLLLLGVALFIINPIVTVSALVFFFVIGVSLQVGLRKWLERVGSELGVTSVLGQQRLQELIDAFREVTVLNRKQTYLDNLARLWVRAGSAQGDEMFIMQVPKIAYESTLVLGAIALAAWQFATSTPAEAITVLALFLAGASRVLPSMLRLSAMSFYIRSGAGQVALLRPIANELLKQEAASGLPKEGQAKGDSSRTFNPSVILNNIYAKHGDSGNYALHDLHLEIPAGSHVALVGPTGAGKSTLADVILGVLHPEVGSVTISGQSPATAIKQWPGLMAYVPQSVALMSGSIRENVALGIESSDIDNERIWEVLRQVDLAAFLIEERQGLETMIGERGLKLSGGQRQRIGLARALYSRPRLLVLDEATSALDSQTESLISRVLTSFDHSVTTITIAHRLATVQMADLVVYLEHGQILSQGTFSEVKADNAAFAEQANLLGL